MEGVIATVAIEGVVTGSAMNGIIRVPAIKTVVVFCTGEVKGFFDDVFPTHLAILKLEVVAVVVVAVEVIFQRDPVIATVGLDDQVVAFACKGRLLCLGSLETQGVGLFVGIAIVFDCIFAMTGTEQIGITFSSATFQMVITTSSFQRVMACTTSKTVVAFSTI